MIKISVVVPVFNVDQYLRQCIDSVLNQKLNDSEIILVDDGSTDQSGSICDEYQRKWDNIIVIHQKNGGLSKARNTGILASSGQYIIFLDSDDWWNPNLNIAEIITTALDHTDAEMYQFSSIDYYEGKGLYLRKEHHLLSGVRTDSIEHYYQDLLKNGNIEVSAATKILSKEFLLRNDLFFKPGIKGEDNEWIIRVLRHLQTVAIIDEPIYIYRRDRPGSITNTIGASNISDLLDIISDSIEYWKKQNCRNQNEMDFCAYLWFCALGLSYQLSGNDYNTLKHTFLDCSSVCQFSRSPKTIRAYRLLRIAGISITRLILGTYILIKSKTGYMLEKIQG